jgi:hypothetical protein
MALPPENRTSRVEKLEAIVAATRRDRLTEFPVLEPEDHRIIGMFIQLFNYIDFNLRRTIETFSVADLLPDKARKKYPKIHSSEVSSIVMASVEVMDAAVEEIPETLRKLVIIERRREIRNLLGHWAARRIPGQDAIVLMTKDESDAMRSGGAYLESGHVKTAILDLADLRGLIAHFGDGERGFHSMVSARFV